MTKYYLQIEDGDNIVGPFRSIADATIFVDKILSKNPERCKEELMVSIFEDKKRIMKYIPNPQHKSGTPPA